MFYKPINFKYQQYLSNLDFINRFNCNNRKQIVEVKEVFLKVVTNKLNSEANIIYLLFILYLITNRFPKINIKKISQSRKSNELSSELAVYIKKYSDIYDFLISLFIEKWGILNFHNVQPTFKRVFDQTNKDIFMCRLNTSLNKFLYSENYLFNSILNSKSRHYLDTEFINIRIKLNNNITLPSFKMHKNLNFVPYLYLLFWTFLNS